MRLIDADKLFEVIQRDKYDMDIHKDSKCKAVHHGEYQHFLKRIAEQPEVHLSICLACPDGQIVKNFDLGN